MYIAVSGNIGSGKTTLAGLLAKHFNWEVQFEDLESNPYLNNFYEDMQRWSFNLQVYFLHTRFKQILDLLKSGKSTIHDRTIYEDAYIFAPNLHSMGLLSTRDYNNYLAVFELLNSLIQPPDILIYLRASVPTLVKQIQKRGRDYEASIRLDYLNKLNERYESWIEHYDNKKLIVIDVDNINFSENQEHLGMVIEKVNAQINGLFTK